MPAGHVTAANLQWVITGYALTYAAPLAIAAFALAVLLGGLFVRAERRAAAPMLPFTIFADPARRAALAAMLLMGGVPAGYLYFISLYLQDILDFSALRAGLALVPATATVMATSIFLTRRLLPKLGVKRMLLLGLAAIGVGQVWLSQITAGGSYQVNVLDGVMLTAFGLGIAFPTVSIAVTAGIPARQQGVAGGLFVTAQQVGAAAGLAVLATVACHRGASAERFPNEAAVARRAGAVPLDMHDEWQAAVQRPWPASKSRPS